MTIKEEETNEYYDPDKSRNGGGYHQPLITVTLVSGIRIAILDTSCGEFGARVDITMSMDDTRFGYCSIDSMNGYELESTFDKDIELHRVAKSVIDYLGYGWAFYYKQEVDEYYD